MLNCKICGEELGYLPFKCNYCGNSYCKEHRLPENHDCAFDNPTKIKTSPRAWEIKKTTRYTYQKTIIVLMSLGIFFGFLTIACPIGFSILVSYGTYSVSQLIWPWGAYGLYYSSEYYSEYVDVGIVSDMVLPGTIMVLLIVLAMFILAEIIILKGTNKTFPRKASLLGTIAGLIFLFAPIIWMVGNEILEMEFFLQYIPHIGFFTSFIAAFLVFNAVYFLRK
ncbi:MAG: AN1-type zinc finger domain-containing protein [Promethearchaeota archaeon]